MSQSAGSHKSNYMRIFVLLALLIPPVPIQIQ